MFTLFTNTDISNPENSGRKLQFKRVSTAELECFSTKSIPNSISSTACFQKEANNKYFLFCTFLTINNFMSSAHKYFREYKSWHNSI